jgi:hypothetical protein
MGANFLNKNHQRAKKSATKVQNLRFEHTADTQAKTFSDVGPADDAAGIGADNSLNTNQVVLTTEAGTVSQTERYILTSTYGTIKAPEQTSDGFRCLVCGQLFSANAAYRRHYLGEHLQKNAAK